MSKTNLPLMGLKGKAATRAGEMKWTVRHDAEFVFADEYRAEDKLVSVITNFSFVRCFSPEITTEPAVELWLNRDTMTAVPLIRCKEEQYRRHLFVVVGNRFPHAGRLLEYARQSLVPVGTDVDLVLPEGNGICMFVYYYSRPTHYAHSKSAPAIPPFLQAIGITAESDPHDRAVGYTYPCVPSGGYDWVRFCNDAIYAFPPPRGAKRSRDEGGAVTAFLLACAKRPEPAAACTEKPEAAPLCESEESREASGSNAESETPSEVNDSDAESEEVLETGAAPNYPEDEEEPADDEPLLEPEIFDLYSDPVGPLDIFFDPCATFEQRLQANIDLAAWPADELVPEDTREIADDWCEPFYLCTQDAGHAEIFSQ